MAGGGTLLGHKSQDPLSGQLNGLGGSQILGYQQKLAVRQLKAGVAAQNIIDPMGHIPDIRRAGVHVLIIHSSEHGGEFLTGVQSGIGGSCAAFNGSSHAFQVIQVVQHQHLHFYNGGLFFAQFDLGLFIQGTQLLPGSGNSFIELCLLSGGIAGGNGNTALRLAVNHGRSDGHAGEYRQTNTSFHTLLLTCPARGRHHRW